MNNRHKPTHSAIGGGGRVAKAVAATVHDAMTDTFLQPFYTPGYDALLGQMVRDLTPENIFEYNVAKMFGCLVVCECANSRARNGASW